MKLKMIAGALALGLALPAVAQGPMGPMTKADFLARGKAQLEAFDTNHDGAVSREELVAAITKQMGGPPPAAMVDAIMGGMDTDHDGKITMAEAVATQSAMFDRADANHDGSVTPEEMMAMQQQMQAQKPQ